MTVIRYHQLHLNPCGQFTGQVYIQHLEEPLKLGSSGIHLLVTVRIYTWSISLIACAMCQDVGLMDIIITKFAALSSLTKGAYCDEIGLIRVSGPNPRLRQPQSWG